MCTVYEPLLKITIKGEEYVRHFQGVPYVDNGAEATMALADGTEMPVPVKTISNAVPADCETVGLYEIKYEAFGPDPYGTPLGGKRKTARRLVDIGKSSFRNCNVAGFDCSGLFDWLSQ